MFHLYSTLLNEYYTPPSIDDLASIIKITKLSVLSDDFRHFDFCFHGSKYTRANFRPGISLKN